MLLKKVVVDYLEKRAKTDFLFLFITIIILLITTVFLYTWKTWLFLSTETLIFRVMPIGKNRKMASFMYRYVNITMDLFRSVQADRKHSANNCYEFKVQTINKNDNNNIFLKWVEKFTSRNWNSPVCWRSNTIVELKTCKSSKSGAC